MMVSIAVFIVGWERFSGLATRPVLALQSGPLKVEGARPGERPGDRGSFSWSCIAVGSICLLEPRSALWGVGRREKDWFLVVNVGSR